MRFEVSEQEFRDAIGTAREFIRQGSAGAEALQELLAHVYETTVPINLLDDLRVLDLSIQKVGFALIIGRCLYGRPNPDWTQR